MSTEIDGLSIYYSVDESIPDNFFPKYSAPIMIPPDAAHLKVITYQNGKQAGQLINIPVADLQKESRDKIILI